jgi:DNA polymerase-3 subunit gamma/tau
MTHTALARKYRPTRFADLVAQEHVAAGLAGAVAKSRVAHGYLLTGPRGVGKTTAARILAMALNCEAAEGGEPCGQCDSCRRIWSGAANLDVVEIDAASHRGVDDARELRERAMYAASGPDRYKVYIVDEAHMLTREAWNALLKILEEPPSRVVFVFATTEPQKIANTSTAVLSRLQRFDFRAIGPASIRARLRDVAGTEGLTVEDDALVLLGQVANGAMRDALSMLDQVLVFGDGPVTAERVREALGLVDDELYAELLQIVAERRSEAVFPFVAKLVDRGTDLAEFVVGTAEVLRFVLIRTLGGKPDGLTEGLRDAIEEIAPQFAPGDLLRMLTFLTETETVIRRSPNARLQVEALILRWTILDRTVEIADVLDALRGGGSGAPGPAARDPERPPERPERSRLQAPPERTEPPADPPPPSSPAPASGGGDLDAVREVWAAVADRVGRKSLLLKEAISQARPTAFSGQRLTLEVGGGEIHAEGLERHKGLVEDAVSALMGQPIRVAVTAEDVPAEDNVRSGSRKRQTVEDDREARLQTYRATDPSLDKMAQVLDLELSE